MNGKEYINFSAADIERYHKGMMTTKEMHDLEKAALDDPFLADALEGYASVPVNQSEDISLLEKKLNERINKQEEAKVIPLQNSKLPWLRIAALFILIAGAGLITYQYVSKAKTNDVAKSEAADVSKVNPQLTDTTIQAPAAANVNSDTNSQQKTENLTSGLVSDKSGNPTATKKGRTAVLQDSKAKDQEVSISEQNAPIASAPKTEDKKENLETEAAKKSSVVALKKTNPKPEADKADDGIKDTGYQSQKEFKTKALNEAVVSRSFSQNNATNTFRGQVLDANNNPLPFANVTNIQDNVGTYTDAKGYFTLVSPDSMLNVQIHSVGFENNIAQLKNNITSNTVVLQQDNKNIASTVISNRKTNTERKRQENNIILEEPEPSDGWYNYDAYIANNIEIPDEVKTKNGASGEVELSFNINKDGEPTDIKVEKSVCKQCDAEAIRLLKAGPKWKKKKKSARAKVAVAF